MTKEELERAYGSDEALGVNQGVVDTQTCFDYADYLIELFEDCVVAHLPDPNTGAAMDGDNHQFVVVENRFIVDPWVVEWSHHALKRYTPTAERAVYDLQDPEDRSEILRLYGHPATWTTDEGDLAIQPLPQHWED
jgi:hypothetical protein